MQETAPRFLDEEYVTTKTPVRGDCIITKTLANYIERELQKPRCVVYEEELTRLWPTDQIDREKRISEFAKEYGFSLQFYRKGICAIFAKERPSQ